MAVDLAAHFDSKFVRDYVFLGATDSAAPIGMMLAAAQALTPALRAKLAADSHTPCFRMVFFDGEEAFVRWSDGPDGDSIYGSRHLAAKWAADADPFVDGASPPRRRIQSMRAMALLDLLGAARPELTWHFSSTRNLFEHMQATEARARSAGLIKGAGGAHSPHYLASNGNRSPISDDHLPWLVGRAADSLAPGGSAQALGCLQDASWRRRGMQPARRHVTALSVCVPLTADR